MQHPAELSPLGKVNQYLASYQPTLLFPIAREIKWAELGLTQTTLPYQGVDIWNGYELSWLTETGKPVVRVAEFIIAADSPYIIESKSFKLYLNSFNQTVFSSVDSVRQALIADLSKATGKRVEVNLYTLDEITQQGLMKPEGKCIDELDVHITQYDHPSADLLLATSQAQPVEEKLYSHLLKSNCPVTGQPDWATLSVHYKAAKQINYESLLQYIISFRQHADFHEQCIERIFLDLNALLQPTLLVIGGRYIRRGGLDINPYRSLHPASYPNVRLARQ